MAPNKSFILNSDVRSYLRVDIISWFSHSVNIPETSHKLLTIDKTELSTSEWDLFTMLKFSEHYKISWRRLYSVGLFGDLLERKGLIIMQQLESFLSFLHKCYKTCWEIQLNVVKICVEQGRIHFENLL